VGDHDDDDSRYGDRFPGTTTGRIVAAGLMVGGIALWER
jgi:hypothetical protein